MKGSIFRKKSICDLLAATGGEKSLKRELGAFDLTLLGIGAIIGTGIFVLTGTGAVTAEAGADRFICHRRSCVFICGFIICRICFKRPGFRFRLHVYLCDTG